MSLNVLRLIFKKKVEKFSDFSVGGFLLPGRRIPIISATQAFARIADVLTPRLSHNFKPDNGKNQRTEKKHPPKSGWFVKNEDAQQHSPDGSDARPNGIGNADGDGLCGFCQKHGTQYIERGKARNP